MTNESTSDTNQAINALSNVLASLEQRIPSQNQWSRYLSVDRFLCQSRFDRHFPIAQKKQVHLVNKFRCRRYCSQMIHGGENCSFH